MSDEDVGALDVDFSKKSVSEEGWKIQVKREGFFFSFCIRGYMNMFVDLKKEPVYNSFVIL